MPDKQKILELLISQLENEVSFLTRAAKAAHEAATHEESKSEDSHDTRGIEASYLAGAQAQRANELDRLIVFFKRLSQTALRPTDRVQEGALLELESHGKKSLHFYVSQGGGLVVSCEGRSIQVLTPLSPLGEALEGSKAGDVVEIETQGSSREYEVLTVR